MDNNKISRIVDSIISESLREAYEEFLEEQAMTNHVDDIINESIKTVMLNEKKKGKKISKKKKGEEPKKGKKKKSTKDKISQVEKYFEKPGVNSAAYAYKLYPRKSKSSARSLLKKKLLHRKNDNGYPYHLDSQEGNQLFSMISNATLSE